MPSSNKAMRRIIAVVVCSVALSTTGTGADNTSLAPPHVAIIAHNMGDDLNARDLAWVRAADVIEIDVLEIDGELIALHPLALSDLSNLATPQPQITLEQAWDAAIPAGTIQLDLKSTGSLALKLTAEFLQRHRGEAQVIISSREPLALTVMAQDAPEACRYLSIKNARGLRNAFAKPDLMQKLDGVSVSEKVLDVDTIAQFHAMGIRVGAWTVNDPARAEVLVAAGVDAITTDNPELALTLGGGGSNRWKACDRPTA